MHLFRHRSSTGLSLIELLIVIAIFAIVSMFLLMIYRNMQEKAADGVIVSALVELAEVADALYDEYRGTYNQSTTYTVQNCFLYTGEGGIDNSCKDYGERVARLKCNIHQAGADNFIAKSTADNFCLSTYLASDEKQTYCMDSTGVYKSSPYANYTCQIEKNPDTGIIEPHCFSSINQPLHHVVQDFHKWGAACEWLDASGR